MSHIHTLEQATIYAAVVDGDPALIGCVATPENGDETDRVVEERWNKFVTDAYRIGLEPDSDEPYLSITADGKTFDHYLLVEVN